VSLTIRFELEARVELIRASEHYRNVSPEIGLEFSRAFRECVQDILNFPDAFKHVGDGVGRASLPRFPYFISRLTQIAFLCTPSRTTSKISRTGSVAPAQVECIGTPSLTRICDLEKYRSRRSF
jgi:hypothetical protein